MAIARRGTSHSDIDLTHHGDQIIVEPYGAGKWLILYSEVIDIDLTHTFRVIAPSQTMAMLIIKELIKKGQR
jgi:hypothetical protein